MKVQKNKSEPPERLFISLTRAAPMLGVSRATAYRLAASGELPARRIGGRMKVRVADLDRVGEVTS